MSDSHQSWFYLPPIEGRSWENPSFQDSVSLFSSLCLWQHSLPLCLPLAVIYFFVVENFNWPDIDRFDCKCIFNLTDSWIRRQECRQVFCLLCLGTFNISLGLHPISYVIYLHFWHKSLKKSAFCTHHLEQQLFGRCIPRPLCFEKWHLD